MKELRNILFNHYKVYPHMQLCDFVKLVFQNEFAGGHMISDEQSSLLNLLAEYKEIPSASKVEKDFVFEDIGNNLCRIQLNSAVDTIGMDILNRMFVQASNENRGTVEMFEEKLRILRALTKEGGLPFGLDELDGYLDAYKKMGYPPVSHSEIYKARYSPHYRVVSGDLKNYIAVFCAINSLLKEDKTILAAIDGNSGSGKSRIAKLLARVYDCNVFHMDDFFLLPEYRTEERFNEAGGNVDYVRFHEQVIKNLLAPKDFQYEIFNCQTGTLRSSEKTPVKKLNIIEGVYSTHLLFREVYDLKICLCVNETIQNQRILARSGEFMLKRFQEEWIPLENRFFSETDVIGHCDLVIDTSDFY